MLGRRRLVRAVREADQALAEIGRVVRLPARRHARSTSDEAWQEFCHSGCRRGAGVPLPDARSSTRSSASAASMTCRSSGSRIRCWRCSCARSGASSIASSACSRTATRRAFCTAACSSTAASTTRCWPRRWPSSRPCAAAPASAPREPLRLRRVRRPGARRDRPLPRASSRRCHRRSRARRRPGGHGVARRRPGPAPGSTSPAASGRRAAAARGRHARRDLRQRQSPAAARARRRPRRLRGAAGGPRAVRRAHRRRARRRAPAPDRGAGGRGAPDDRGRRVPAIVAELCERPRHRARARRSAWRCACSAAAD